MSDEPTPLEVVRDLGLEIDGDAQRMVDRVLRLAKVHEKAVKLEAAPETAPTEAPSS